MKKGLFLILLITSLFFISCNSNSDVQLKTSNTVIVTASTGVIDTLSNYTQSIVKGGFYSSINGPNDANNYYELSLNGVTTSGSGQISIEFISPNLIKSGILYSYTSNIINGISIYFNDWIATDSDNAAKATIEFSSFRYPGRIAGIVTNYDTNGKVLATAEFDFISQVPVN